MDLETVRRLNAINRVFYRRCAGEFDASRATPWSGWERLEGILRERAGGELSVLDVGCGNGRFAAFLDARWEEPFRYLGVDASEALLDFARARRLWRGSADWRAADFVETPPADALPAGAFSLVSLFGVLHHVPGAAGRRALLRAAAARLRPGGMLAVTSWQFEAFRRFRDRLLPWDAYNRGAPEPIDLRELEPGDHLLPWGDAPADAVRYCHFESEADTACLLDELGLEPVASYATDGREGRLNRYFVLRRSGEGR